MCQRASIRELVLVEGIVLVLVLALVQGVVLVHMLVQGMVLVLKPVKQANLCLGGHH